VSSEPSAAAPRIALVTGAGSGIGKAVALCLAANGFTVVACGRTRATLDETLSAARDPARLVAIPADIGDPASVEGLFAEIERRFGRIDLLFNNAGIAAPAEPLDQADIAAWQRVLDINLTGAFLCSRAAFALMKRQDPRGGRIINNGSVAAHVPRPNSAAYAASKHALTGLTKATALDGRPFGIACGQIDIGNASTRLGDTHAEGSLQADGRLLAEPVFAVEHVASTVLHMASLPLDVNIPFLTLMATGMPYMGRG